MLKWKLTSSAVTGLISLNFVIVNLPSLSDISDEYNNLEQINLSLFSPPTTQFNEISVFIVTIVGYTFIPPTLNTNVTVNVLFAAFLVST